MALTDYRPDAMRCTRCSYCKWIPFDLVKSHRFAKGCPSVEAGRFHAYSAGGKLITALSLMDGRSEASDQVVDVAFRCQLCGNCDVACKLCRYDMEPILALRELRAHLVELDRVPDSYRPADRQDAGGPRRPEPGDPRRPQRLGRGPRPRRPGQPSRSTSSSTPAAGTRSRRTCAGRCARRRACSRGPASPWASSRTAAAAASPTRWATAPRPPSPARACSPSGPRPGSRPWSRPAPTAATSSPASTPASRAAGACPRSCTPSSSPTASSRTGRLELTTPVPLTAHLPRPLQPRPPGRALRALGGRREEDLRPGRGLLTAAAAAQRRQGRLRPAPRPARRHPRRGARRDGALPRGRLVLRRRRRLPRGLPRVLGGDRRRARRGGRRRPAPRRWSPPARAASSTSTRRWPPTPRRAAPAPTCGPRRTRARRALRRPRKGGVMSPSYAQPTTPAETAAHSAQLSDEAYRALEDIVGAENVSRDAADARRLRVPVPCGADQAGAQPLHAPACSRRAAGLHRGGPGDRPSGQQVRLQGEAYTGPAGTCSTRRSKTTIRRCSSTCAA